MITLIWVAAIVLVWALGTVKGMLAIIAITLLEGVLELKAIRRRADAIGEKLDPIALVFDTEPEPMTEDRADALLASVMEQLERDRAVIARHAGGLH